MQRHITQHMAQRLVRHFSSSSAANAVNASVASQLSPAVAFLIRSDNYDPSSIAGSGKQGRILKGDVLKAIKQGTIRKFTNQDGHATAAPSASSSSSSSAATATVAAAAAAPTLTSVRRDRSHVDMPLSQIRRVIASRLSESKHTIPHAYASATINMDAILSLRAQWKDSGRDTIPSVNDMIVKAAAMTLRAVPGVNSVFDARQQQFVQSPTVDVSVAVATDTGLITPIVKRADAKRLDSIQSEIKELATRAKANKLKPEEFQGGSFTISNLGMFGIQQFSAIINPPQVCILAVGGSMQRINEDKMALQLEQIKQQKAQTNKETTTTTATKTTSTSSSSPSPSSPSPASPSSSSSAASSSSPSPSSSPSSTSSSSPAPAVRVPTSTYMSVTLVSDERAVDGEMSATFLATFKTFMENPAAMI